MTVYAELRKRLAAHISEKHNEIPPEMAMNMAAVSLDALDDLGASESSINSLVFHDYIVCDGYCNDE